MPPGANDAYRFGTASVPFRALATLLLPIPSALFAQSFIDSVAPLRRRLALLDHLDGILNYCRTKVPLGIVEAINGNIKSLLRRGRGYKNLRYLLLKA